MNMLLFDTTQKVVERFDPLGDYIGYETDILDEKLKKVFNLYDYKYYKQNDTCTFQSVQIDQFSTDETDNRYCAAWSMWYLELRLSNADIEVN
jgi:hypothetical protein